MFSSLFSTSAPVDPTAPTFHPISANPSELLGELEPKDTEWLATSSGFVTETQGFYNFLEDGSFVMCQVIHSSIGVWYPTVHFNCKIYNPHTKEKIWKSVSVSNFVAGPPKLDKRSCKADQFSITHKSSADGESYAISANLAEDLQISLEIKRPASIPGFKVGKGPKGGYSYFGSDPEKADGYVIHRFWPRDTASGHIISKGHALALQDRPGMFVHAIQGMRPNLVASRWNFANFQSEEAGGVAAVQMEFKTQPEYGGKGAGSGGVVVNIGGLVVGGKLVAVTGETKWPDKPLPEKADVMSRAMHLKTTLDSDTGYTQPTGLHFTWSGPSVVAGSPGSISAELDINVGGPSVESSNGLVEKVDFLAEIPYVLKTVVNYVASTKPYMYQWLNPATLAITGPESLVPGGALQVKGTVYNEATFITE